MRSGHRRHPCRTWNSLQTAALAFSSSSDEMAGNSGTVLLADRQEPLPMLDSEHEQTGSLYAGNRALHPMARSAGEEEIRLMWLDLADDYRYLLDLERYSSTPRRNRPGGQPEKVSPCCSTIARTRRR